VGEGARKGEMREEGREGGREGGREEALTPPLWILPWDLCFFFAHPPPPHPSFQPSFPPSSSSEKRAKALRVLGLSPRPEEADVKEEELKEAFRRKAMECHPDR